MPEVFEISVTTEFSAAHALQGYPGDCAQVHGHNWTVEVFVRCRELNAMGIGIDFREVKQAVRESIENLDHSYLNEHPSFTKLNPSSENIAKFLYKELSERINSENARISRVKVSETPKTGAYYWEE
ncbi:MAG TPA: 6-carboxytetrahydropterin synthase QueD [Syntrophales bacterium]|nr:6-carboxytetrahydropterin synthase QueD [Syntrophales bacterium]